MEQKFVKCKNVQFNSFNFDGKAVKGAEMLNGRAENKKRQGWSWARKICPDLLWGAFILTFLADEARFHYNTFMCQNLQSDN